MKHIEVSRKIALAKKISQKKFKEELIARLERIMEIKTMSEDKNFFSVAGTTGAPASVIRNARLDMDVSLSVDKDTARIIFSGYSRVARSLAFMYGALFLVVLLVGLLPGSIETSADLSSAVDALVFLIFGIFIMHDLNQKLSEPQEQLETVLKSLDTQFG